MRCRSINPTRTAERPIGVVILNYNTLQDTRECLRMLLRDEASDRLIFVLDNGSREDESQPLRAEFGDQILLLRSSVNIGFARGCNVGATILRQLGSPRSLLLLNSDATISWPEVRRLDAALQAHPRAAAVGPDIRYPDGTPQAAGGRLDFLRGDVAWILTPPASTPYAVEVLHGAVLLVRSEAWRQLGGFDDEYFSYSEETDWCVRAREQGWDLYCIPACTAHHKARGATEGKLSPMHVYLWARNRMLFMRKRGKRHQYPAFVAYVIVYLVRYSFSFRRKGDLECSTALLRGVRDGTRRWVFASRSSPASQALDAAEEALLRASPGPE